MNPTDGAPDYRRGFHQYENIDNLTFQVVDNMDPDYDTAIKITNPKSELTAPELERRAREETKQNNWWLNEYWQAKGDPKEQLNIQVGGQNIELYNFGAELTPEQTAELQGIMAKFNRSAVRGKLKGLQYILIDDNPKIDPKTNEPRRGYAYNEMNAIGLYPRAVSNEPHRVPNVSSFAGTLSHEVGHILADTAFVEKWKRRFGWEELPDDEVKVVGDLTVTKRNTQPERLISSYAGFTPEEDICESLVAAINNPQALDPERLVFLQESWLAGSPESGEQQVTITKKTGTEIQLPKSKQPIKYKVVASKIFVMGKIVSGKR